FVSGNPGHTSREFTVAQLLFERRVRLPRRLGTLSEMRGQLTEFAHRGAEQKRFSNMLLFGVENALNAYKGRDEALLDPTLIEAKRAEESKLRARMAQDKRPGFSTAFSSIENALKTYADFYDAVDLLERGRAFDGELFAFARGLLRAGDERQK